MVAGKDWKTGVKIASFTSYINFCRVYTMFIFKQCGKCVIMITSSLILQCLPVLLLCHRGWVQNKAWGIGKLGVQEERS